MGCPRGLLNAYGSAVHNGVEYRFLEITGIDDGNGDTTRMFGYMGSGSVLFNMFRDGQHGPAFASIPTSQPLRISLSHRIDADMQRRIAIKLNDSITLDFLPEVADELHPIRCAVGGFARGPVKARDGSKTWIDDVVLADGSLTYAPSSPSASRGTLTTSVKLGWTAAPGASSYRVYRLPNETAPISPPLPAQASPAPCR